MELVLGLALLVAACSIFVLLVDIARHQRLAVDLLTEIHHPGSVFGTFEAEQETTPKEWWG